VDSVNADGRLPVPSLDDRRYQDLVDQAMRLRDRYCPEWTSTEPGDPGVALIEIFAYLADQLLYRLNQVPDRLYSSFLNMVGVHCRSAAVARTRVDFLLGAPPEHPVRIPAGTCVATVRTDSEVPIEFMTVEDAVVRPSLLHSVAGAVKQEDGGHLVVSPPGESWVELAFTDGAPNALIHVEVVSESGGFALSWQCWTTDGWTDVVAEERPEDRTVAVVDTGPDWAPRSEGEAPYRIRFRPREESRVIVRRALCIGVAVTAQHAGPVAGEDLGNGNGRPRQRFRTRRAPVLPEQHVVRVGGAEWTAVDSLVDSFSDDRHCELDRNTGEVQFGDGVHGAVPPDGDRVTIDYLAGGGTIGNVAARRIAVSLTLIPFVSSVRNRLPAVGGADPEPVEEARAKAPALLRSGWRAVSTSDFERLTTQASSLIARARCLSLDSGSAARILLVPHIGADDDFDALQIGNPVFEEVRDFLEERRSVGVGLVLEPPLYQGVRVVASVTRSGYEPIDRVAAAAEAAVRTYLHPVRGGRDGRGWPFGRSVLAGELFGVLLDVPGVELVDEVRIAAWNPVTDEAGEPTDRIDLGPHSLCWPGPPVIRVR
jgi:hypothetical protein